MNQNNYKVRVYSDHDFELWNDFVAKSKNATFLFHRHFMEYHKDRFEDSSLLIFKNNQLVALLPANRSGDEFYSHQGLTYGGFITVPQITILDAEAILEEVLIFLRTNALKTCHVKQLPSIYYSSPSYEFEYALKKQSFKISHTNLILAVNLKEELDIHKSKLKNYRKAEKHHVSIKESDDLSRFWDLVLQPKLKEKYNSKPVHSLSEITQLKEKFPSVIRQFNAYLDDDIVAGITLFEKQGVIKSQYGAANQQGEKVKALDYLFLELIHKFKKEGKSFFSMGTVSNTTEKGFNEGMLKQKQELGCKVFLQDFYKIEL